MDHNENVFITKKELCIKLGCSAKVLRSWLKKIPDLDYNYIKKSKHLPPKYVETILKNLA